MGFIRKKNTRDIGSKQASSAPLLLEFQTFKSSEVKIGGYSKEKNFDLSFVTIVAGISKHSNHLGFKNPSFFCDVLWIPNVAESFSDEILHHGSCNSFTEIKKAVIDHLKQVFGEPPPLR